LRGALPNRPQVARSRQRPWALPRQGRPGARRATYSRTPMNLALSMLATAPEPYSSPSMIQFLVHAAFRSTEAARWYGGAASTIRSVLCHG
jgi:hypothetical protein